MRSSRSKKLVGIKSNTSLLPEDAYDQRSLQMMARQSRFATVTNSRVIRTISIASASKSRRSNLHIVRGPATFELGDNSPNHEDTSDGKLAHRSFRCKNKAVGTVLQRIVNIVDFRQRRHWGVDHRLQQIGGNEDRPTDGLDAPDYILLLCGDLFERHLP